MVFLVTISQHRDRRWEEVEVLELPRHGSMIGSRIVRKYTETVSRVTMRPGLVFPVSFWSEWVDGGTTHLGAILLHGISGSFKVGGQVYNGVQYR